MLDKHNTGSVQPPPCRTQNFTKCTSTTLSKLYNKVKTLSRFPRHRINLEGLLVLKWMRKALGQDQMLLRYFEMFDNDKLEWNLAVDHLMSLAEHHDNFVGRGCCLQWVT